MHKLAELQRLFTGLPLQLVTLADLGISAESPEDGATFEENAVQKARFYAALSNCWTLADDSGLEVDALAGAPGVRTRRYAGVDATDQQNYEKLLVELHGLPRERRVATFVCCMALVEPEHAEPVHAQPEHAETRAQARSQTHAPRVVRGECSGRIVESPRGTGGFGYDPVFEVEGRTMAERSPAEKDELSHRGTAARLVAAALRTELIAD